MRRRHGHIKTPTWHADVGRMDVDPKRLDSGRPWPPQAERSGAELSAGAVLGVVLGMYVIGWLVWTLTAGFPSTIVSWRYEPTATGIVAQVIAPSAIGLLLWLLVLGAIGWRRAAGLVVGSASLWGIVPLVLFGIAGVLAAFLSDIASRGAGVLLLAAVGFLLAAFVEELAYRGFLAHGLTRRIGGTGAVLLGSAIFAAVHIPTLLGQETEIVRSVAGLFGFGVVLCRIRAATGSLWFPTAVHALHNLTTVGVVIWAFPGGRVPEAFALLNAGVNGMGILLAIGLLIRTTLPRSKRELLVLRMLAGGGRAGSGEDAIDASGVSSAVSI
jgi:uncharacterized protein